MPCDTKGSVCLHTFKFQIMIKKANEAATPSSGMVSFFSLIWAFTFKTETVQIGVITAISVPHVVGLK